VGGSTAASSKDVNPESGLCAHRCKPVSVYIPGMCMSVGVCFACILVFSF